MKKLALTQILSLMAILYFVASCSTVQSPQTVEKTYSDETLREFEAIEKNDLRTSPASRPVVTKPTPKSTIQFKAIPTEKHKAANPVLSIDTTDLSQLSAKNQERLQEINQNLAFFCMKHRKDSIFQDQEQCLAFTKKVLEACEKKHKLINTVMVNCIKVRLKKRQ